MRAVDVPTMRRAVLTFLLTIVLAYGALCLVLFLLQRSLIYFPTPRTLVSSAADLTLSVEGAILRLTVRPRDGAKALIYFGGNAEDVSYNLESFARTFPNHAIYLMHYRGYGGSTGKPSEAALHADAEALYERVREEHAEIVVVGRSLGSGIAIRLAASRPVARLVLVTPYDSIVRIAKKQFPWVPVGLLLRDRYESWREAPKIDVPTLILAAAHDEIIPRANTESLLRAFAPGVAEMAVIPGVGHNSISESPRYWAMMGDDP